MPIANGGSSPLRVPALQRSSAVSIISGVPEGFGSIVRGRLGQPEDGENLVADVFLDGAVAGKGCVVMRCETDEALSPPLR